MKKVDAESAERLAGTAPRPVAYDFRARYSRSMAIEPLQHVTLLVPRGMVGELTGWLQKLSVMHVVDAGGDDEEIRSLERPAVSTEEADVHIRRLSRIKEIFGAFGALESSFVEMIVALPERVGLEELERIRSEFDYRPLYEEVCRLEEDYRQRQSAVEAARAEYEGLEFFRLLPFEPGDIHALKRTKVWVGSIPERKWDALRISPEAGELVSVAELRRGRHRVDICAVALEEDAGEGGKLLRAFQFEERRVPPCEGTRRERMDELVREIQRLQADSERCRARIKELASDARRVSVLLGFLEAEREKVRAQNSTLNSRRIAVLTGFILRKDLADFQGEIAGSFPAVSGFYRKPSPDEDVPVEITNSPLLQPLRFLVDLFGRPDYFSFDPTPFLAISFLVFFGMCFSDAVYGFALALTGYLLARRARPYEGIYNLCMLFCYAGIFTMVIGVLMGSWASDLWRPEYLGEGNILYRVQRRTAMLDPIDKAVLLLVVSIGIGVLNQFYGIILKGYGLIRKGRVWDAAFDAGLWFLVLPGFLIAFSSLFFSIPSWLLHSGFALMIAGGAGLILTQGRDADGIAARFGTGLISIYGIMGSYGCVSFLSDILSYSRLIALGLTTTIVGMAFNIIADLLRGAPLVGTVLFVVMLLLGHTFNFMVSMLASFVHPARLIFLEFFNRFYEPGGTKFKPLSLSTDSVIVES